MLELVKIQHLQDYNILGAREGRGEGNPNKPEHTQYVLPLP